MWNICGMECVVYWLNLSIISTCRGSSLNPLLYIPGGIGSMLLPSLSKSKVIQGCSLLQLHPLCHANSIHCVFMLF